MIKQKKLFHLCFALALVVFLLAVYLANAGDPSDDSRRISRQNGTGKVAPDYVEGEVLVKFKVGLSRSNLDRIANSFSLEVKKQYSSLTMINGFTYAYLKSKDKTTEQITQELSRHPDVVCVSPNYRRHIDQTLPNDPRFNELWGMHNTGQTGGTPDIDIDAPEAWDVATGSSSVLVAVIDTGIDYNHPDLQANIWVNPNEIAGNGVDDDGNGYIDDIHGINGITGTGEPMDDHGHGTHCSGTIGAVGDNGIGVAGINWHVKLIGAKSFDASGYGYDADAITCIDYLVNLKYTFGHNIVAANASWGGTDYNQLLKDAIDAAGVLNIVFCAAAGNDGTDNDTAPHYPSSYTSTNIIAVTAVDSVGAQFYNYGATSVDLGAPGRSILSTVSGNYLPHSGDIFFDNMESGAGQWTTGGTLNTWAISTNQEGFANPSFPVPSPSNFWSDSPGVSYSTNTNSWLMNASDIDLSPYVGQDVYIGFGSAIYIEDYYDHGYVEVSGDGGGSWTSLKDFSGYAYYWQNPYCYKIPDAVKTANFRFRFHLVTDSAVQYWGWLIDDVGIGTELTYGYESWNGTSMATPHVTGAVALAAALMPSETGPQRIAKILASVVELPSLSGKCTTEGMLNLYNVAPVQYSLTIASGSGGTTNPAPGTYSYNSGQGVQISALPTAGYGFTGWSGDIPLGHEGDNPLTIIMDSNKNVTANFTFGSAPDINMPITSYDFGYVPITLYKEANLTVQNLGTATLTISSVTRSSGSSVFTVVSYPSSVAASSSGIITIGVKLTSWYESATFAINSNDPDEPTYNFTASATGDEGLWLLVKDQTTNDIYSKVMDMTDTWSQWDLLSGSTDQPLAGIYFWNRAYVMAKGLNTMDIWYRYLDFSGVWGSWEKMTPGASPSTSALCDIYGKLYLVVRGADNGIYLRSMNSSWVWGAWTKLSGSTSAAPVLSYFNDRLHLIVKGLTDNTIWHNSMDSSETWAGWELLDGASPTTAGLAYFNNRLYLAVKGMDNMIYLKSTDTSGIWSSWAQMPLGATSHSPAIAYYKGYLYMVVKGLDDNIYVNKMNTAEVWAGWTQLTGGTPTAPCLFRFPID